LVAWSNLRYYYLLSDLNRKIITMAAKKIFNAVPTKTTAKKSLSPKASVKKVINKKEDAGLPLSVVIRHRIEAQKARFHANDNIAAFIKPGELERLVDEVSEKMQAVLESLVIDTRNDHNTRNTSRRVAKMYVQEVFNGRYVDQPTLTKFPNVSRLNELMIIGPITVRSACSHHLCPIMGRIWIGVLPSKESALIGLSKYSRLTEWVMCRPQIQEEAVVELADMLEKKIKPIGVAVVMEADHFCMQWRGVKDRDSKMINSVMRGSFLKDSNLRREFLALIDRK
jgi:GTP cyclohydrolase IA